MPHQYTSRGVYSLHAPCVPSCKSKLNWLRKHPIKHATSMNLSSSLLLSHYLIPNVYEIHLWCRDTSPRLEAKNLTGNGMIPYPYEQGEKSVQHHSAIILWKHQTLGSNDYSGLIGCMPKLWQGNGVKTPSYKSEWNWPKAGITLMTSICMPNKGKTLIVAYTGSSNLNSINVWEVYKDSTKETHDWGMEITLPWISSASSLAITWISDTIDLPTKQL